MIFAWLSWLICVCRRGLRGRTVTIADCRPEAMAASTVNPGREWAPAWSPGGPWAMITRRCRSVADRFTPIPLLGAPRRRWLAAAASP